LPATCQPPAPPRLAASVLPGAALGGTASPRLLPPSRSSAFRANDSGALSGPASLGQLGQRGIQPVGDRSRLLGPSEGVRSGCGDVSVMGHESVAFAATNN
jgi:hypothetical protein